MAKRNPRDVTRHRILNQAHILLRDEGLPDTMAVRLTDVLEQLGLTTGAAYNIWESQSEFRSDLAEYVALNAEWKPSPAWREKIVGAMSSLSAAEAAERLLGWYVAGLRDLPDEPITHYFWTLREAPTALRDVINSGLQSRHDDVSELFGAWRDAYGLQIREPYSEATVTDFLSTMIDGLVLRSRFERSDDSEAEFDRLISMIVDLMRSTTEPVDN